MEPRLARLVWPVYGVAAGISFAGALNVHAEPVVALVVAGVAAILGVTQSAWYHPHPGGRRRNRNRNRSRL